MYAYGWIHRIEVIYFLWCEGGAREDSWLRTDRNVQSLLGRNVSNFLTKYLKEIHLIFGVFRTRSVINRKNANQVFESNLCSRENFNSVREFSICVRWKYFIRVAQEVVIHIFRIASAIYKRIKVPFDNNNKARTVRLNTWAPSEFCIYLRRRSFVTASRAGSGNATLSATATPLHYSLLPSRPFVARF